MTDRPQRIALVVAASVLFCTFAIHVPLERITETEIEHVAKISQKNVRRVSAALPDAFEQSWKCDLPRLVDQVTGALQGRCVSVFDVAQPQGIHLHQIIIPLLD